MTKPLATSPEGWRAPKPLARRFALDAVVLVLCLAAGLALRCSHVLLRAWDERTACEAKVLAGRVGEPWGPSGGLSYSLLAWRGFSFDGPNGVPGDDDDVELEEPPTEYALLAHLGSLPPLAPLGLWIALAWLRWSPWSRRPAAATRAAEVAHTLLVASVPFVVGASLLAWAVFERRARARPWWPLARAFTAIPPQVAAGLTLLFVDLLLASLARAVLRGAAPSPECGEPAEPPLGAQAAERPARLGPEP